MIYSELLKGINPNWSAKYKARYLYWNLCKNIVYDQRFIYGSNKKVPYSTDDKVDNPVIRVNNVSVTTHRNKEDNL